MNKPLILVLAICLLSACSIGRQGSATTAEVYDLGPAPTKRYTLPQNDLALEIRMPPWLESTSIQYRLLYSAGSRLHEYGYARWAGTPDDLVEQRLRQQLGLPTVRDGVAAPCLLSIDIDHFGQVFSTANESRGVINGRARLLGKGRLPIESRQVMLEYPAPTPNAQGGVSALTVATDALAGEMAEWLDQLMKSERTAVCRSK